jgi:hypothetical protein
VLLVTCCCVVPLVAALVVSLRCSGGGPGEAGRPRGADGIHATAWPASRWEALTEEMTRRGNRRGRRRRSDAALRRRHLAAVLPADARR